MPSNLIKHFLFIYPIVAVSLPWSYQCLYNGMVGGIHVSVKGEGALSITVVGCIALRSNDPILKETHKGKESEQMKSIETSK